MGNPLDLILGAMVLAAALTASGHAVIRKRDPRSAALWLLLIWMLPALGPALYLVLGINRVQRRAAVLRSGMARYRTAPDAEVREQLAQFEPLVRMVGAVVKRPLLSGNSVEMLVDGPAAFPAMLEAIDSARVSIGVAFYIFHGNGIGADFIAALARAVKRGVLVRVLIDDVSARFSFPSAARRLREAGVPVAIFNPTLVPARIYAANLRNHRKILVVDGELGFTGGMNIDRRYWRPERPEEASHDTQFRLRGPVVAHLSEVFVDDWKFSTDEALRGPAWFPKIAAAGRVAARGIEAGPDESIDRLRWTLLGALGAARASVRIGTPYFLPDTALISALNAAALRGVEVDIVLPQATDLPHVRWATYAQLWQVLERGCRVWASPGTFDHSKLMTIDRAWSLIGSANWDTRSLRLNFELDVECYDPGISGAIEDCLLARRATAVAVTLEEVNARPLPAKLRDGIARLFTPYL
jgi:cardiolipin synthase